MASVNISEKEAEALFSVVYATCSSDIESAAILNLLYKKMNIALSHQKTSMLGGKSKTILSIDEVDGPV